MRTSVYILLLLGHAACIHAQGFVASLSSVSISPGSTVVVNMTAQNVTDMCGFEVNVRFDPSRLEVMSVQQGDFLSESGLVNTFWLNPQIDNAGGKVVNIVGLRLANGTGRSGTGVLARIQMREKTFLAVPYLTYVVFEETQTKFSSSLAQSLVPIGFLPAAIKVGQSMAGDNTLDDNVDMKDFAVLASFWLAECEYLQDECFWSDSDNDTIITLSDLLVLCEDWLR